MLHNILSNNWNYHNNYYLEKDTNSQVILNDPVVYELSHSVVHEHIYAALWFSPSACLMHPQKACERSENKNYYSRDKRLHIANIEKLNKMYTIFSKAQVTASMCSCTTNITSKYGKKVQKVVSIFARLIG